jgi:hypothetical protein
MGLFQRFCCATPGLHGSDDGLPTFVNMDVLDFDRLLGADALRLHPSVYLPTALR